MATEGEQISLNGTELKEVSAEKNNKFSNLKKDSLKIIFLIWLYMLQVFPLGLLSTLPYILTVRKVSYSDQGILSFAGWPYAMKLLWAPIVDSVYFIKFGRRKSWILPSQFMISIFLIALAKPVLYIINENLTRTGKFIKNI